MIASLLLSIVKSKNFTMSSHRHYHHKSLFVLSAASPLSLSLSLIKRFSSSMPSPIPRSSSLPQISKPESSFPSNRSTSSSSYLSCPLIFQSKHRKNATSCDLTKESLSEHNRLQEALDVKKIKKYSPYYKGLTDSQLYLKSLRSGGGISPSRESRTTRTSKTSTLSTIFVKFQGIGLCFKGKRELIDDEADIPEVLPPPPPPPGMPSPVAMNSRVSVSLVQNEIGNFTVLKENIPSRKEAGAVEWKPLRERYLMVPLTEDSSAIVQEMQKESSTVEEFIWAKKYRPKRLKDFICNRYKAELLLNLVTCANDVIEFLHVETNKECACGVHVSVMHSILSDGSAESTQSFNFICLIWIAHCTRL